MPDVDLVVSERLRVVDVGGKTVFQIRLRNYGTKEATNLVVTASLSKNLRAVGGVGVPTGIDALKNETGNEVKFVDTRNPELGIKRLGPQEQIIMGITVEATGADPQVAICKVSCTHDKLTGPPLEDTARVRVMPSSRDRTSGP